jgi:hypothetical protein
VKFRAKRKIMPYDFVFFDGEFQPKLGDYAPRATSVGNTTLGTVIPTEVQETNVEGHPHVGDSTQSTDTRVLHRPSAIT